MTRLKPPGGPWQHWRRAAAWYRYLHRNLHYRSQVWLPIAYQSITHDPYDGESEPTMYSADAMPWQYGSMALNGMSVLVTVRKRFPNSMVTEIIPKCCTGTLLSGDVRTSPNQVLMDTFLSDQLGVDLVTSNEHEWDAAVSALAAFNGLVGKWRRDLHSLPWAREERLIAPAE